MTVWNLKTDHNAGNQWINMEARRLMRDRIDTREALRLWLIWRNWREVACRLIRESGQTYTADAVQKAVWQYYRGQR